MLYGFNPNAVIDALKERSLRQVAESSKPDRRRIALVIEGGGMRSVCSAGGAMALAQLGLGTAFDEVIATSAGVMNASYLLTNQAMMGMSVYFENCRTKSFLNPWRFWKMLNVDYIIDHVVAVEKPLNLDALARSSTKLYVAVCERATGKTKLLDVHATQTPILRVFKAAMAIPLLYNRTVEIDGDEYVDAGTVIPFPLDETLALGVTDILILLTRPANFVERRPNWAMRRCFDMCRKWADPQLRSEFGRRHERSQAMRDLALGRTPLPPGVNVAAICTDEGERIETGTTDVRLTHDAAFRYGRKTMRVFGADPDTFLLPHIKQ